MDTEHMHCERHSCRVLWWMLGALVCIAIIYVAALTRNTVEQYHYIGKPASERDTITISGQGKVTATPDIAQVALGYTVERKDVAQAYKENVEKMNGLVSALKGLKIDPKDIATSSFDISPVYDYGNGKQTMRGYQVNQQVLVKIRDLSSIGDALTKAASLGLNQVGNLSFTIDDPKALEQEARLKALDDARAKAEQLARASGVSLGSIVNFSESGSIPTPRPMYATKDFGLSIESAMPAPAIEPGSQEVVMDVTVTYALR